MMDDLGGDAGMVGARQPERVEAAHPVVAGQRVHDRLVERMAHVQDAGHVRRWQLDRERRTACFGSGGEVAAALPFRAPERFDATRVEALRKFHGSWRVLASVVGRRL